MLKLAGCLSPGKPLRLKAVFEVTAAARLSAHGVRSVRNIKSLCVGHSRVTISHLRATMSHLRLTSIGYLKATVANIRVTLGQLWVTLSNFFL